jgi:hypothetical protein
MKLDELTEVKLFKRDLLKAQRNLKGVSEELYEELLEDTFENALEEIEFKIEVLIERARDALSNS